MDRRSHFGLECYRLYEFTVERAGGAITIALLILG